MKREWVGWLAERPITGIGDGVSVLGMEWLKPAKQAPAIPPYTRRSKLIKEKTNLAL